MKFNSLDYELRAKLAYCGSQSTGDERVLVYDQFGHETSQDVWLSSAHKYGIIHRTADVIVILPEGDLLIQERRSRAADGSPVFSLSAGGHIAAGETAKSAACIELLEELSLELTNQERLVPLSDSFRGWPLSYFEGVYKDDSGRIATVRTNQIGQYELIHECNDGRIEDVSVLKKPFCPWNPPPAIEEYDLCRWIFNQELDIFYILRVTEAEASTIQARIDEVRSVRRVSEEEFIDLFYAGQLSQDTTQCLLHHDGLTHITKLLAQSD